MSPDTRAEMYSVASIKACEFRTTDCFDVPLNQSIIRARQPAARRVLNNCHVRWRLNIFGNLATFQRMKRRVV